MPNYVERDGDWVWRPPGSLDQTKMYVWILRVSDLAALQGLCDELVSTPSGNSVSATPFSTSHPFVLFVCADIQKAFSKHPIDITKGYAVERDMGFFVPVNYTNAIGNTSIAMLLPYLYVDNLAALLVGREIFGFPKLLGQIQILENPPFAELIAPALPSYGPSQVVVDRPIMRLETINPVGPTFCAPGAVINVTLQLLQAILNGLGLPIPLGGFSEIPMLFLKQFRDALTDGQACHQSIVRAVGSIDLIRSACIHRDDVELTLFPHDSIDIAGKLGLGAGPTFQPVIGVSADLDFSLDFGTTEWTA